MEGFQSWGLAEAYDPKEMQEISIRQRYREPGEAQRYAEIAAENLNSFLFEAKRKDARAVASGESIIIMAHPDEAPGKTRVAEYRFPFDSDLFRIPESIEEFNPGKVHEEIGMTEEGLRKYIQKTVASSVFEWQLELFREGDSEPEEYIEYAVSEINKDKRLAGAGLKAAGRGELLYFGDPDAKEFVVFEFPKTQNLHNVWVNGHEVYPYNTGNNKEGEEHRKRLLERLQGVWGHEDIHETYNHLVNYVRSIVRTGIAELTKQVRNSAPALDETEGQRFAGYLNSLFSKQDVSLTADYQDSKLIIRADRDGVGRLVYWTDGNRLELLENELKLSYGLLQGLRQALNITEFRGTFQDMKEEFKRKLESDAQRYWELVEAQRYREPVEA